MQNLTASSPSSHITEQQRHVNEGEKALSFSLQLTIAVHDGDDEEQEEKATATGQWPQDDSRAERVAFLLCNETTAHLLPLTIASEALHTKHCNLGSATQ